MKKLTQLITLMLVSMVIFAQEADHYTQGMKQGIVLMDEAQDYDSMEQAASLFERISETETAEWLPAYYAALCYTIMSFMEQEDKTKKSAILTKAQELLDKTKAIYSEDSEIYALQGMVYQAMIQVNPMINGMLYGSKASTQLDKAIAANGNNPRPHYLKAMSLYYTPALFGGSESKACELFEKADAMFDAFQVSYPLAPNWGQERNLKFLNKCRELEDEKSMLDK